MFLLYFRHWFSLTYSTHTRGLIWRFELSDKMKDDLFFGVLYKALNLNFIGDNFDYSKSIYFFEKNIISKLLPDELENSKKMIKKVIFEEENEKKNFRKSISSRWSN